MKSDTRGFTLIELLLAMTLLSVLALLLIGNFNSTLKRGRDSQRKNDLGQLQKALELYYEDNKTYPKFDIIAPNSANKLCTTQACDTSSETFYMIKVPNDPSSTYTYTYVPEPTPSGGGASDSYYLYSFLENTLDTGSSVSQTGYTTGAKCDSARTSVNCKYYVGSSNSDILTPNP